jgi:hypothetical protein
VERSWDGEKIEVAQENHVAPIQRDRKIANDPVNSLDDDNKNHANLIRSLYKADMCL